MGKVLIKFKYDMNDADYIYGIHAMDKERWEKWVKVYKSMSSVCMYHNDCERDLTPDKFLSILQVTDITDEEYATIKKLGLIGFGQSLPIAYYQPEDTEFELEPEDPEYVLEAYNPESRSYINIEDKIQ